MRIRNLFLLLAASALLAPATPGSAPAQSRARLSDKQILRNFDVIALRREHRAWKNPRITKWVRPIRLHVDEDVRVLPVVRASLDKQMARLSSLTGIPVRRVSSRSRANFIVIFTRAALFEQRIRANINGGNGALIGRLARANCVGIFNTRSRNSEILRAVVIIPVDSARAKGLLQRCIVEETTQVMGLPNDSDDVTPSIFNDKSRVHDLTWQDRLLLRILYHPHMRVGLPRLVALLIARNLVPKLRAQIGQ